jgi:hypothetical protein
MRRGPIFVAAMAVACLPAVTGLVGNQSFSHSVPVRVPSQAHLGTPDATGVDIPQPSQARPSPSATRDPDRDDHRGKAESELRHEDAATPSAGRGPSADTGPRLSPDTQRGRAATGNAEELRGHSPTSSTLPQPNRDRDPGKGPNDGRSGDSSPHESRGHDRGHDRENTGDASRGDS